MKRTFKTIAAAAALAAGTAFAAVPASAGLIADFTDNAIWSGATGNTTFTAGGVTLTSQGGLLNLSQGFDGASCPAGLTCDNDGVGISDDEVTFGADALSSGEVLFVEFATPKTVTRIDFLDLFGAGGSSGDPEAELAQFNFFDAADTLLGGDTVLGTDLGTTGHGVWSGVFTNVSKIRFFADSAIGVASPANTDFAVAAIRTPEPGILGLLGVGVLGLGLVARRRAA